MEGEPMRYYANYIADYRGQEIYTAADKEFVSAGAAIDTIRGIAAQERQDGHEATWAVWNGQGECVAFGCINSMGKEHRMNKKNLFLFNKKISY